MFRSCAACERWLLSSKAENHCTKTNFRHLRAQASRAVRAAMTRGGACWDAVGFTVWFCSAELGLSL